MSGWRQIGVPGRKVIRRLREQRDSVVRSDAGTRQRVEFEEVAGGVEAPADAGMSDAPAWQSQCGADAPMPDSEGGHTTSSSKRKPGAEAPGVGRLGGRVRLKLVSDGMGSAARRKGSPNPALPIPLLRVIEGGAHDGAHPRASSSLRSARP